MESVALHVYLYVMYNTIHLPIIICCIVYFFEKTFTHVFERNKNNITVNSTVTGLSTLNRFELEIKIDMAVTVFRFIDHIVSYCIINP